MGELVASMAEYAERERAQMYDDYGGGDDAEMPEAPPEEDEEAAPPEEAPEAQLLPPTPDQAPQPTPFSGY